MKRSLTLISLLLTTAALTISAAAQGENLRFFLSFVPNVQFAPFYVMAAERLLADAGYTLVIEHGDEHIGLEQIAVGDLNFGAISGEQVVLARANDRPVVYVYEWFDQYPIGLVIPSTTNATTVMQLAGRRVGVPGRFGATYIGLTALLAAHDMTEFDIQLEAIGFVAPDVICAGGVDAAAVYLNNEPLQIARRAAAGQCGDITGVTVLPVADYASIVSNGIVTNERTLAENPALVEAVVVAFDEALRVAINSPAYAYLVSLEYVEGLPAPEGFIERLMMLAGEQEDFLATNPTREQIAASRARMYTALSGEFDTDTLIQFEVLLATIDLWESEALGVTSGEAWEQTQATLLAMGLIDSAIDLEAAYTNQYVPDAAAE